MTTTPTEPGASGMRPANRRDVVFAVRRTPPERRRFRWRRWLVTAALCTAAGGGLWYLTQSGLFAVSRLGTGAYRFTDERALKATLAPLLGRNLWALGQSDVAKALAPLPWVREVYVRRRLPGAVDIELIEWRPLLVLAETGTSVGAPTLVLVEDGRVLPFPRGLLAPALPVLTGVLVERSATGPARLPEAVAPTVLALVTALEQSGLESVTPVDFVVARPDGFGIVLQHGEGTLLVGREEFADRLTRYLTAREHIEAGLEVDLRFHDRLTVRAPATAEEEEGEGQEPGADGEPQDQPQQKAGSDIRTGKDNTAARESRGGQGNRTTRVTRAVSPR